MSSTILPPTREQLCARSCSNKIHIAVEKAFCKVSSNFEIRCAQKPRDAVAGKRVLKAARTLPEAGWYYMIDASECVVQTTWKNLANAFDDILKYVKCMEEACHGSIKLIGEQWDE
jgi:hypothetical protein